MRAAAVQRVALAADVYIFYAGKIKIPVDATKFNFALDAVRAGDDAERINQFTPRIS
jgi:hypothetical protein